jgi:hypothetical protein
MDMEEHRKEESSRVIQAGFAKVLRELAFTCSAPIYWYSNMGSSRSAVMNSGTIFFVDAGHGPIGVTARHVIQAYREAALALPHVRCQIANVAIDPLSALIAEDARRDIATLCVDSGQLQQIGKIAHQNPCDWPPKPPEVDKGVFFGGYLGKKRRERPWVISWLFAGGLDIATSVHDDYLAIRFSREDWIKEEGVEWPTEGESWGGVSGGPVFALVVNHVYSWRLAGVATEFNSTFELLYAASLRHVSPDGSMTELS